MLGYTLEQGATCRTCELLFCHAEKKLRKKMLNSDDPITFEVGANIEEKVNQDFRRLGVENVEGNLKDIYQKRHLENLKGQK